MNTTVCTACVYPDKKPIRPLVMSCKRYGVKLVPFGIGQKHISYIDTKIIKLREFLRGVTTSHVLYVDGTDVLWTAGLKQIEETYAKIVIRQKKKLMIGSEWKLYPFERLRSVFDQRAQAAGTESAFRFHAPGLIMGGTQAVATALGKLIRAIPRYKRKIMVRKLRDDDMAYWALAICDGTVDPAIDYECEMTIPLGKCTPDMYVTEGGKFKSCWTNTYPHILHFNRLRRPVVKERMADIAKKIGYKL